MDAWDLTLEDLDAGRPVTWGWGLRRLPGGGVRDVPGIWYGRQAANDPVFNR